MKNLLIGSLVAGGVLALAFFLAQPTLTAQADTSATAGTIATAPAAATACDKCPGAAKADPAVPSSFATVPAVGTKARCPVSGETFTVSDKTVFSEYQGRHYAFCCPGCKAPFDADPAKYAAK